MKLTMMELTGFYLLYKIMRISNNYLGKIESADVDTTDDQIIYLSGDDSIKYIIRKIIVTNASVNLSNIRGNLYTGPNKTGTSIVNLHNFNSLNNPDDFIELTIVGVNSIILRNPILYFSMTDTQGSPASVDLYLFGDSLN
jgi:hypothetical protein